ncbi:ferric reductase-like transmembrane domain-containing protein [Novosphingobium sp. APW14]|uniref:ferric reductase-like transmembrane domain-containing protein n=1 Tax=Novosphingobium sp. APW14 TaxID=3077237 RepID=UPI0028DEE19B|nr:ferric reductase-like transmembrane domain-containing protein [Novosphingobium sp. APW14]MDT9013322.1 ferric reductase-like transmembrane domain-containing protein [Novosphingobium sp. APW14]
MRTIINSVSLFWGVLALPGLVLLYGWSTGAILTMDMLHPTGETSARLMIAAMLIGPLAGLLGPRRWLLWLLARRRALGVAAFGYAAAHLAFYGIDMGSLRAVLGELPIASIWTGWLALALMLPMALTSNQAAMKRLRAGWKRVQQLAYPAAVLTLLHWWLIHDGAIAALVHFAPLALLWLALALRQTFKSNPSPQAGV